MFVDWPAEKKLLQEALDRNLAQRTYSRAPMVSEVAHINVREGNRMVMVHPDGCESETPFETYQHTVTLENDAFVDADAIFRTMEELATAAANDMERGFFNKLRALPPASGGLFKSSDPRPLHEQFIDALDRMVVSFDDDGSPNLNIVLHPGTYEAIKPQIEAAESDPEIKAKLDEAMEHKRHEWLSRESTRRLVD